MRSISGRDWQMASRNRAAPELKPAAPIDVARRALCSDGKGPVFAWLSRESGRRAENRQAGDFPSRPGSSYFLQVSSARVKNFPSAPWNSPFHEYSLSLFFTKGVASRHLLSAQRQLSDRLKSICLPARRCLCAVATEIIAPGVDELLGRRS